MMELVIWSTGDRILTIVKGENCPRKQQNGVQVRKKEMAELVAACADFPGSVGDEALPGMVRWATRQTVLEV